jgi:hypothetical protein
MLLKHKGFHFLHLSIYLFALNIFYICFTNRKVSLEGARIALQGCSTTNSSTVLIAGACCFTNLWCSLTYYILVCYKFHCYSSSLQ